MGVVLPGWADEVLDIIGVSWPNVDEDDYREMADAMREFADDIDDGANEAHTAIQGLVSSAGGSVAVEALNAHWSKVNGTHLKNLGECGRMAATALDGVAILIEGAKLGAIVQLGILAAEVIAAQAAAPFTLGLSEVGALAATQATRVIVKRLFKEVCQQVAEQVINMALTPVEEALGAMVGDLVVQLGANALGVQDGVDLGHAAQAGKDGFSQGVQDAKKSAKSAADNPMELLSAGSRGGGGSGASGGATGGGGFSHDPEEHDRVVTGLQSASGTFRHKAGGKIGRAKSHHGRTRGKDAIADAANAMLDKVIDGIEDGVKKTAKHLGDNMTRGVKQMAKNHHDNDKALADHFTGLNKNGKNDPKTPNAAGPATSLNSAAKGKDSHKARHQLGKEHPNNSTRPDLSKEDCGDPVDVATGRVYLTETDIALPSAVLPLSFTRKFESSCRVGRHMGPSWTSTVDQRLEIDEHGVVFVGEDGMLLSYPTPEQDRPVLPTHGPRWPLTLTAHGDWALHNPDTGHTRYFSETTHTPGLATLDEIADRHGNHITFDYDDTTGAPLAIRHSGGYHVKLTCNDNALVTALHLAGGADDGTDALVTTYAYDEAGNLTDVIGASGRPNRFEYDSQHRMTAWIDTNGSRYEYTYDQHSRCISQGGSEGHLHYRFNYGQADPDTGHRVTTATNSLGNSTRYQINERLQVIAQTDPLGHTTHTTYDAFDRMLSRTDPLGRTTRYERDAHGRLTSVHLPDGSQTHASYNALGKPVEIIEAGGLAWRYTYDERGNQLSQTDPTGATSHFTYNQVGHMTVVSDPAGNTTHITCDAAGLALEVTSPTGAVTSCRRDAFGRIQQATNASGDTQLLGWTAEGNPAWRQLADGTRETWQWDGEGNLTRYTDPAGRTTHFTISAFDQTEGADRPQGARYGFTHDAELRLTAVTAPDGRSWNYRYDAAGRLTSETDFDGRTLTYTRDAAGQLITRTNGAGQTLTFTRDPLGRVTHLTANDGHQSTFAYAPTGALIETANADATLSITLDNAGHAVSETLNGRTLHRERDQLGQLTGRRTPTGATSRWARDAAYRITGYETSGHTLQFTHDAMGHETSRTLEGLLTLHHTFDFEGHLTHQTLTTPQATVCERRYDYRTEGLSQVDDSDRARSGYHRDGAGRITAIHSGRQSETYDYAATGDQLTASWPAHLPGQDAVGQRAYDGSRLNRAGRTHYAYDAQGRLIRRRRTYLSHTPDTWHYSWNAEDRLTHVTTPDGHTWRYRYDPLGRRIAKERYDGDDHLLEEIHFTWDGNLLVEEARHRAGETTSIVTTWDYLGLRPLTQTERKLDITNGQEVDRRFFLIVTTPTGQPTELVNEHGEIAWQAHNTLWGLTAWSRDARAHTALRAPGQYFDPETGLHYNFNRYYDPETARYISPDPLGLAPAINPYTYVDDPLTQTDPLGLAKKCRQDITWGGRVEWDRDHRGRQYEMRAIVSRDMLDEGTKANSDRRPGGFRGENYGQARGHMLARSLGGTGDDLDNLFTITQSPTNHPDMYHYEKMVYDAVDGGDVVNYNVYLEYDNDQATIPRYIQMEAWGRNGTLFDTMLENPAWRQEP
ncbi:RHS repeat-associated core domain-containing protein [Streptomyces decoyicus]